ncbi:U-box domain-containing protein 13-like [Tripterygium wilfordii]|uniref:U-box domain-containing protein 12 n=1 Tax=Tripterygium wilfordii TaxID=458696 RepID=A0A7J7DXF0_TRIWF|nr:U-box domain-containing protein 13-like [Tripterygium wilfordii]KAF5750949.1 U-box domain-containing protein 13-like [Tripterygium wilfordii]
MADGEWRAILRSLTEIANEILEITEFNCVIKKPCRNLSRRLRILTPLFEELGEIKDLISEVNMKALAFLKDSMEKAKDLLKFSSRGSKIYMVLQREQIISEFRELEGLFEQALGGVSFGKLDISSELKEQIELVCAQFGRASKRLDASHLELYEDFSFIYNHTSDANILQILCKKLELRGAQDLKQESLALEKMCINSTGDLREGMEEMYMVLKKYKELLQAEDVVFNNSGSDDCSPTGQKIPAYTNVCSQKLAIPDDFRCPISLEMMKDPVIISTGQTYERACIKQWLEAGHRTCPKTRQILSSTSIIPNYVLVSIISNWCEANNMEPPRNSITSSLNNAASSCSVEDVELDNLLRKLKSNNIEDQRFAAANLRLLAKHNSCNRLRIAEAGAIPPLNNLLYANDSLTQEHAVTAILNLSIRENIRGSIMSSGSILGILHVLENGSMEARENAAATFSVLSSVEEYRMTIGASGAIPALVILLSEGRHRGKVDAARALFQICIYQRNKGRVVRAGAIPQLVNMLLQNGGEMVGEALAIMALLASHPDGKAELGALDVVPTLVELVANGTPRNKENAAAVLAHLCLGGHKHLSQALTHGFVNPLLDLAENGTARAKLKALQLLKLVEETHMQSDGQISSN